MNILINSQYKVMQQDDLSNHDKDKQTFHYPENWQGDKQWSVYVLQKIGYG